MSDQLVELLGHPSPSDGLAALAAGAAVGVSALLAHGEPIWAEAGAGAGRDTVAV